MVDFSCRLRGLRWCICFLLAKEHDWGFQIGVNRHIQRCKPCCKNMMSARQYLQVVEKYLANELEAGRVVGPLDLQKYPQVQVSPFGVIPKSHQPTKWQLIVDLSLLEGEGVNDCINKPHCVHCHTCQWMTWQRSFGG